ncbi:SNF2 family helicase [Purpureocillium lilacinum]|uniref:HMG box transcription factor n=1 Tax=Purpureocillium lilacinum TaxID=33203 RepID=A0A179GQI4_PURLI|nr:SNF2 family helicase [Purpureocillium lilacinum]KAK4095070.1 transcriptional regulator family: HMG [Purpureocillium lilacinum]OAQ80144.1 SNF2 family helicase [Purpureocillium lilacinum]OAQ88451.1 SNF2 family helicase [Purpureocillium lilacinum]PWI74017.1 HMG box transcription factor [Purpureocillium lilacinum]GJN74395.1 hypothetical protein PLICBS_008486 [Purpureocillium lilacinum]
MTQVLALAARHMEAIGAPVRRHVDLGQQYKQPAGIAAAADGGHSPSPLRSASSRKRASTIHAVDADRGMQESPSASSAGTQRQDGARDLICLCTPAPKIPRPRNAFILYRQHHQAQVTADNPKLSNPDISKIIGEKWKNEDEDVKQTWKNLAEEEKQRHQTQYPNYRYQPRRGNKPQAGWGTTSPTEEPGRCPKCHGRAAATPQTPSTPFATSPAAKVGAGSQGRPSLQRADTDRSRRSSFEQSPTSALAFPTKLPSVRDVESGEPTSPGMKRRRANDAGGYHPINGSLSGYVSRKPGEPAVARTDGPPQTPAHAFVRTPLPELGGLPRSQSGPMPPPFRPSPSTSWLEKDSSNRRHSGFDESLRLPPLQSSVPPSPSRMPSLDTRRVSLPMGGLMESPPREPRGLSTSSMEDSIMAIPFSRKLSVLASICRTAPPLARDADPGGTRGAFIAVEGSDARLLREVGTVIEKTLVACGDIDLKVWKDESPEMDSLVQASSLSRAGSKFGDSFEPYFDVVSSWQKKSKQIGRHITGKTALIPSAEDQRADGERVVAQARSTEACTPPEDDRGPGSTVRMPVALARDGFSLTVSDRYACTMPIQDTYSPLDHWQWMASLWRGTVCPDLVVHVMPAEDEETGSRRVVELSRRLGSILVKLPSGKEIDEGTERRIAFEVMEWMREGSFREALPQGWRSDAL